MIEFHFCLRLLIRQQSVLPWKNHGYKQRTTNDFVLPVLVQLCLCLCLCCGRPHYRVHLLTALTWTSSLPLCLRLQLCLLYVVVKTRLFQSCRLGSGVWQLIYFTLFLLARFCNWYGSFFVEAKKNVLFENFKPFKLFLISLNKTHKLEVFLFYVTFYDIAVSFLTSFFSLKHYISIFGLQWSVWSAANFSMI